MSQPSAWGTAGLGTTGNQGGNAAPAPAPSRARSQRLAARAAPLRPAQPATMPPDEMPVPPKDFDPSITSMEVMRAAGEKAAPKAAREVAELRPILTNVGLATQAEVSHFARDRRLQNGLKRKHDAYSLAASLYGSGTEDGGDSSQNAPCGGRLNPVVVVKDRNADHHVARPVVDRKAQTRRNEHRVAT